MDPSVSDVTKAAFLSGYPAENVRRVTPFMEVHFNLPSEQSGCQLCSS